jgi:hypothetical protein
MQAAHPRADVQILQRAATAKNDAVGSASICRHAAHRRLLRAARYCSAPLIAGASIAAHRAVAPPSCYDNWPSQAFEDGVPHFSCASQRTRSRSMAVKGTWCIDV